MRSRFRRNLWFLQKRVFVSRNMVIVRGLVGLKRSGSVLLGVRQVFTVGKEAGGVEVTLSFQGRQAEGRASRGSGAWRKEARLSRWISAQAQSERQLERASRSCPDRGSSMPQLRHLMQSLLLLPRCALNTSQRLHWGHPQPPSHVQDSWAPRSCPRSASSSWSMQGAAGIGAAMMQTYPLHSPVPGRISWALPIPARYLSNLPLCLLPWRFYSPRQSIPALQ